MLSLGRKEVADRIIQERIALLTEIIRTGNEVSAIMASLQLALIGTKQSADALMDLIRGTSDSEVRETLTPLIGLSRHRNDYLEELELLMSKESIENLRGDIENLDQVLLKDIPLWQEIAEALEKQCNSCDRVTNAFKKGMHAATRHD